MASWDALQGDVEEVLGEAGGQNLGQAGKCPKIGQLALRACAQSALAFSLDDWETLEVTFSCHVNGDEERRE